MASFDIKSLFTNILLTKTLHIFVQNLYRNQSHVGNLTTYSFYMFESVFTFNENIFE